MRGHYAERTSVSVEKSKAEIETILRRFGADQFVSGWSNDGATIGFRCKDRMVRFDLRLPDRGDKRFREYKRGTYTHRRDPSQAEHLWEQACRESWRALALVIKAKLAAVAAGISTFEQEFLAHVLLPDGSSVGQFMAPQLTRAYAHGEMPVLLVLPGKVSG